MLPERERQNSHRRKGLGRSRWERRQEMSKMLLKSTVAENGRKHGKNIEGDRGMPLGLAKQMTFRN